MNKKLPSLYVNMIQKKINNNAATFYSSLKERAQEKPINNKSIKEDTSSVDDKVRELFNSPNYVYKMKVVITLKDNTVVNKDIIGQTGGKLITMDEDLIDINDIKEIKF